MTRSARISRFFGDDDHEFRLGIGEAEALDEETGFGLMQLLERTTSLHVAELRLILRLGLIGAGMKREAAARLVKAHVVEGYILECSEVAAAVLAAAIRGVPDDPPGYGAGEPAGEGTATSSPTDASATA